LGKVLNKHNAKAPLLLGEALFLYKAGGIKQVGFLKGTAVPTAPHPPANFKLAGHLPLFYAQRQKSVFQKAS